MISTMFIPIQKVDAERREVWGYAAVEEPDNSDEIMDYASSRPYWIEWSQRAQKRSGGKSYVNLRSMHQNVAAGKLISLRADDARRGFYIGAKIIDDGEWNKVVQGVYTGFSVGGSYLKRWVDYRDQGKMRYTAKPTEVSIVDAPCIPSATFQMIKADGVVETREFQPGNGDNVMTLEDVEDLQKEFDESKHPRDHGKFAPKGGGSSGDDDWADDDETSPEKPLPKQTKPEWNPQGGRETPPPGMAAAFKPKEDSNDKWDGPDDPRDRIGDGYGTEDDQEFDRDAKQAPAKFEAKDDWEDDDEILPEGEDQYADAKRQLDAKLDAARRHKYEPIRQHPAPEKQSSKRVSNPDKERMRQADKGHAHNMGVLSGNPEAVEREMQAREKQEREMRRRYGKVEGDKTLTKKFELFKELANEILDEIDTLEKADAPGAPEKLTDIQLESEVGESYEVEHMPEPVATLSLTESVGKSQEELAQSAVKTQDLSSILEAWLPKVGAMVKAEVANAILGLKKEESPAPAVRKVIVVRHNLTKGEKEN